MLLGAGRGTRLAPLTHDVPKILAPLGDRTLLEWQLDYLAANGVDEVALNVHHHADQVELAVAGLAGRPPAVRISHELELLGTAGALVPFRGFFRERFLLLYGDVVTDIDLRALAAAHDAERPLATLAWYRSSELAGKGTLELDPHGRVTGFAEKQGAPGEGCVNAGVYVLEPRVLDLIEGEAPDFGHDVWPRALAAGEELLGVEIDGYLRDVGSPDALAAAARDLQEGRLRW